MTVNRKRGGVRRGDCPSREPESNRPRSAKGRAPAARPLGTDSGEGKRHRRAAAQFAVVAPTARGTEYDHGEATAGGYHG